MTERSKREKLLAALDAAIERGRAAVKAGRVKPAEEVFDRLEAKYLRMARERSAQTIEASVSAPPTSRKPR